MAGSDGEGLGHEEREDAPEGYPYLPTLPGRDAFDDLIQSWLQEEDPGLPWLGGAAPAEADIADLAARQRQAASEPPGPPPGEDGSPSTTDPATTGPSSVVSMPEALPSSLRSHPSDDRRAPVSEPLLQGMMTRSRLRSADAVSSAHPYEATESGSEGYRERSPALPGAGRALARGMNVVVRRPVGRIVGAVQEELVSGVMSGVKRTFKRSKTAEERAERIKERNRRAQRAFRERQKALSSERTMSYKMLEASLAKTAAEKKAMAEKIRELEGEMLREEEDPFAGLGMIEPQFPIYVTIDDEAPVEYTADDMKAMDAEAMARLYKGYVDVFQRLLDSLVVPESDPRNAQAMERIHSLVDEMCTLNTGACAQSPTEFTKFQVSNLAGEEETRPPPGHWARVVDDMALTDAQKADILDRRRDYMLKLKPILKQRWEIHSAQIQSFPRENGIDGDISQLEISKGRRGAEEAVEQLIINLREEQAMRILLLSFRWQQITTSKQKAVKIVSGWPWYADSLAIGNSLAKLHGAPTTRALLEIDSMPPNYVFEAD